MMLRSGGGDVDPVARAALGRCTRRSRRRRGQSCRSPQKQFPKTNDRGRASNARPRFTAALGFASRARENAARERLRPLSLNRFSRARIGFLGQKLSACTSEPPAHDVAIGWRRRRPRTSRCARPLHPPIAPPPRPKLSITSKTISQNQRPRPAPTLGHDSPPRSASPRARGKTQRESGCGPFLSIDLVALASASLAKS